MTNIINGYSDGFSVDEYGIPIVFYGQAHPDILLSNENGIQKFVYLEGCITVTTLEGKFIGVDVFNNSYDTLKHAVGMLNDAGYASRLWVEDDAYGNITWDGNPLVYSTVVKETNDG